MLDSIQSQLLRGRALARPFFRMDVVQLVVCLPQPFEPSCCFKGCNAALLCRTLGNYSTIGSLNLRFQQMALIDGVVWMGRHRRLSLSLGRTRNDSVRTAY